MHPKWKWKWKAKNLARLCVCGGMKELQRKWGCNNFSLLFLSFYPTHNDKGFQMLGGILPHQYHQNHYLNKDHSDILQRFVDPHDHHDHNVVNMKCYEERWFLFLFPMMMILRMMMMTMRMLASVASDLHAHPPRKVDPTAQERARRLLPHVKIFNQTTFVFVFWFWFYWLYLDFHLYLC